MGSGASASPPKDKKIVIVGAGYGGIDLALQLMKLGSDFTIIDLKDSFYHNIGAVRAITEPGFINKLFIPYDKTFGNHFKKGKVVSINSEQHNVSLEGGETISYDVLVIATGSTSWTPFKTEVENPSADTYIQQSKEIIEKLKAAEKIVIIGGGAVGCEVAGEILTDYKGKEVTLIHSHQILAGDGFGDGFQKSLKKKLTGLGLKLVLGEKVAEGLPNAATSGPGQIKTNKGTVLQADLIIRCTGMKVNSQAYAKSLGGVMNENGSLQVNEFLQVKGHNNVFALGDCNDVAELKVAFRAFEQNKVLKHNIAALFNGKQLQNYNPDSVGFGIGLSLGRKDALGVRAGGKFLPDFVIKSFKSKDLAIARQWKTLNQKVPK